MSELLAATEAAGFHFEEILADGRFHRARGRHDPEWYVANEGMTAAGKPWAMISAGDLRASGGEHVATLVWKSWQPNTFDRDELKGIRAQHTAAKEAGKVRQAEVHERARQKALTLWGEAQTGPHPYLTRKRLPPGNTRVWGQALLIPVFCFDGPLQSLQTLHGLQTLQEILPGGRKKNLPGGRFACGYHPIGWYGMGESKVYVCEGWATGQAIHVVKGVPVVCAFSAGNLLPVAQAVREIQPEVEIVLAADNDTETPGNPGVTLARKAALAVGGAVIVPPSPDGRKVDWWDHLIGSTA